MWRSPLAARREGERFERALLRRGWEEAARSRRLLAMQPATGRALVGRHTRASHECAWGELSSCESTPNTPDRCACVGGVAQPCPRADRLQARGPAAGTGVATGPGRCAGGDAAVGNG